MIVAPACHSAEEKYCRIQWVQHETKWTTTIEGQHCKLNWHGDVLTKWPWMFSKWFYFQPTNLCYYFFLPCPWKRQGSWLGALHKEFSSLTFLSHSSTFHSGWVTLLPDLTDPVSTRPTMTQPTSGWSCTFRMGSRNGFSSVRLSWIELWCCRILVSHHRYMSGPLDELESRMSRQTVSPLTKCDQNGNLILSTMRSGEVAVLSEMPRH